MLKLVFVDMDGTFLDSAKAITPENASALDAAASAGVMVVPCTGRNLVGLPPELLAHPSVRYAVCANGAVVAEVAGGRTLREVTIDKDLVLGLYQRLRDRPVTFDLFADGTVYAERERFSLIERLELSEATKEFVSKFGRAKSYGTKTIGTPDAGAMSMSYFFQGLARA